MSRSLNRVTLIGNLGNDPEVRATLSGGKVANFSLATSRQWKDTAGEKQEKTEWHRVVAWNNKGFTLADVVEQYAKKGDKIYVEGVIEYRTWADKEGQTKYTTEINAREIILLGGNNTPSAPTGPVSTTGKSKNVQPFMDLVNFPEALDDDDDDLPF